MAVAQGLWAGHAAVEPDPAPDDLWDLAGWSAGAASLRSELAGLLLIGWGIFKLVEGVIDHQILGIHHVRDEEGGLIFAAGETSYGEEGYSDTIVEQILPVEFRVEEKWKDLSLIIVLDKSYSMYGRKIALAKEATKAALDLLEETHRFGVVTFDWPGRGRSSQCWMSGSARGRRGGTPSTAQPIAGAWLSPQVV